MTEDEINSAVARKLGWYETDLGWEHRKDWKRHEDRQGVFLEHVAHRDLPNYCRSIAAAWEVLECPEIIRWEIRLLSDKSIGCEMIRQGSEVYRWADTAPMAICLSFLKLGDK
jgi:hypothetical protein